MRIAHLSDIHFGRIAHPAIVRALVDAVNESDADLVAVSGDLTQRARTAQFQAAASMLAKFEAPVLVVPGNHDVYPWWRPFSRLTFPLARYRRMIENDLSPTFETDGLVVLGITSAYGRTIKGGWIGSEQRSQIKSFFSSHPETTFKVLVVHHHLVRLLGLGSHDLARKARRALDVASDAGVDLILCGHLHVSHIEMVEIAPASRRIVIASAGTATSNRGRDTNRLTNFFNLVDVEEKAFTVLEHRFEPDTCRFVRERTIPFER